MGGGLVAEAEGPAPFAGAGLADSTATLAESLWNGDWVDAGLSTVSVGIDAMATASDPFGSLVAAGLGFAMEHFNPLKGWLDDLAGNPSQVAANGQTCANVAREVTSIADAIDRYVTTDLAGQHGPALRAYAANMRELTAGMRVQADAIAALKEGLEGASAMVTVVRSIVRDAIAQVVGALISYAAELVISLGTATPLVIWQCTSKVSALASKISGKVSALIRSSRTLSSILDGLKTGYQAVKRAGDLWNGKAFLREGMVDGVDYHIIPPGSAREAIARLRENAGPIAVQHLKDLGLETMINKKDLFIQGGMDGARDATP